MSELQSNAKQPVISDTLKRVLLYGSAAATILALAVALLMPEMIGPEGFVLAFGIAAVLIVLLYGLWAGGAEARKMAPGYVAKLQRDPPFALSVFDQMPYPMLVMGKRGEPVTANAAYKRLASQAGIASPTGRPPAFELVVGGHPGLSGSAFRLARAARTKNGIAERLPGFEVGGEVLEYDAEITPLEDGLAVLRLRDRSVRDDTGKARAPGVLGTAMLDNAPIGFFSTDVKGKMQYMNQTLRVWLGVAADAPHPAISDFTDTSPATVLGAKGKAGNVSRTEVQLKARDGILTPAVVVTSWEGEGVEAMSRSVVFGNGRAASPAGVAQAIEPAGRTAGLAMDEVFANAPFGVARLDSPDLESAVIEDANPVLVSMTGGKAMPGTGFLSLFDLADDDTRARFVGAPASGGAPVDVTLMGEPPRPVHVFLASDRAGRRIAYVSDQEGMKELETQLFQAQKMQAIGKLAGGVAHDFNNLLTIIQFNCDHLFARHPIGDPSYGELQQINQTVNRAKALVSQLLAFSRKQTTRAQNIDLAGFLSNFTVLLKQVLQESVQLELKHSRDKLTIKADKGHMETALMNLATNARDAMKDQKNAKLLIRTSQKASIPPEATAGANPSDGPWVLIEVIDNGHGMDEKTLGKVFDPFYTTKDVGKGTGLGLSTVYGIIKQSGGYLYAVSKVGEGTTFQIWLPAVHTAEAAPVESEAKKAKPAKKASDLSGRGKILFVEDEAQLRKVAAKTLAKRGYEVIEAGDGEEALDLAQEHAGTIDLMISDVVMPGMDGPTMLQEAREYLADARIVFISGYAEEEFSDVLSRETEVSFLPKPFTLSDLAAKVKEELSRREDDEE